MKPITKYFCYSMLIILILFAACENKNATSPEQKSTGTLFFSTFSPNKIWKINDNGQNLSELCDGIEFDLSPDGQQIVFTSDGERGIDIFRINIDGSNKVNLTSDLDFSSTYPKWSPDGSQIAFQAGISGSTNDTWIMSPDGAEKLKLTEGDSFLIHYSPEWSRDGSQISFIRGIGELKNSQWSWIDELWIMSLPTGESQKLFEFERPHSSAVWNQYNDAIAYISGGNLYTYKDRMSSQISASYTSDFAWVDDKTLIYSQIEDDFQNIYKTEIGTKTENLTNFNESKGIINICILNKSRIAYATVDKQIFIHSDSSEQLLCEMKTVEQIMHIAWLAD